MARVLTLEDVKPLIGNLARSNYYQFRFSNTINTELSGYLLSRGVDPFFISNDVGLLCNAATLPGSSLANTESYNHVGVKESFAHTLQYDQLKLEFYCDNEYKTLKYFENWIGFITSGSGILDNGDPNYYRELRYPEEYKNNTCKVIKFENDNRSVDAKSLNIRRFMDYSFIGLYPTDIYETPLQYGESNIMSITVGFSYDRHIQGRINSIDIFNGINNSLQSNMGGGNGLDVNQISNTINLLNSGVDLARRFINI
ncbi:MAG: hypothetical protein CMP84_13335 [Gammaproteobacteria bacterium]|nr:hypothetical protein [Gammaproteobacteria bacterium]